MMRGTGSQPLVGLELLLDACTAAPELAELAPKLLALLLGSVFLLLKYYKLAAVMSRI